MPITKFSPKLTPSALLGAAVVCVLFVPAVSGHAQGFVSAGTGSVSSLSNASYNDARPASSSADSKPAKIKKSKDEPLSVAQIRHFDGDVHDAILTVDGMVAKVGMNYRVNAPFLYFFIPGVGTVMVAQAKFTNSVEEKNAIKGSVMTIEAGGHQIQVTNDGSLFKKVDRDVYVALDKNYATAEKMPMMGFGVAVQAPYQWPGAKSQLTQTTSYAPPVPTNLRPKMDTVSSYSVTVNPATN